MFIFGKNGHGFEIAVLGLLGLGLYAQNCEVNLANNTSILIILLLLFVENDKINQVANCAGFDDCNCCSNGTVEFRNRFDGRRSFFDGRRSCCEKDYDRNYIETVIDDYDRCRNRCSCGRDRCNCGHDRALPERISERVADEVLRNYCHRFESNGCDRTRRCERF